MDNEEYVKRVLSGGGGSSKGEKEHDRVDTERTRSAGRKRDSHVKYVFFFLVNFFGGLKA